MKNEYEVRGEVTAIFLKRKDGSVLETIISTSDLEKVKTLDTTWYGGWEKNIENYYVRCNTPKIHGKSTTLNMHRFLFDNPKGKVVDHINHNTLDNTRTNLRVITNAQNTQNKKGALKTNSTGIRGVSFNKQIKKWVAHVKVNGKRTHLGSFDDIKLAEQVAIEARKKFLPYSIN